jgi:hypothetical protein
VLKLYKDCLQVGNSPQIVRRTVDEAGNTQDFRVTAVGLPGEQTGQQDGY